MTWWESLAHCVRASFHYLSVYAWKRSCCRTSLDLVMESCCSQTPSRRFTHNACCIRTVVTICCLQIDLIKQPLSMPHSRQLLLMSYSRPSSV